MKDGNLQKCYNTNCMIFMTFSKLKKNMYFKVKGNRNQCNGAHFIFLSILQVESLSDRANDV